MAISDEQAVRNLLFRYCRLIDAGDFAGVGELLADADLGGQPASGDAASIRDRFAAATRLHADGTPRTKHIVTNVAIEVSGDDATSSSYFTVLQQVDDLPVQPIVAGRYDDRFDRRDGVWRFQARTIAVDMVGDVSRHLMRPLSGTPTPTEKPYVGLRAQ